MFLLFFFHQLLARRYLFDHILNASEHLAQSQITRAAWHMSDSHGSFERESTFTSYYSERLNKFNLLLGEAIGSILSHAHAEFHI